MSIKTERLDTGIYCNHWQGHVSVDDVLAAFERQKQLASEDQIEHYVVIIDGSDIRTVPLNLAKLRKTVSGKEAGILVYNAPKIGQTLGDIIGTMTNLPFEFHGDDWDAVVTRAQELLKAKNEIIA